MLSLNAEQKMLVDTVTDIAENEFRDRAFTWEGQLPWENVELLAESGFMGINFDEEYGGAGMSEIEAMLLIETIGRVCPDTANFVHSAHMVAPRAVEMFGTEELKREYLPPVIEGNDYIAIAISEPQAGSDVQAMDTTVREEDGKLLLNGEKTWVSAAHESSLAVVWAKFPEGIGTVLLDLNDPDVEMGEQFTNMAGHGQSQFFMNDVVVPVKNVLVRGREAFKEQLKSLNWERVGATIKANSWARCMMEMAFEYAQDREQFGQPIGDFQGIEWKLADMFKELEAARALTYKTAEDAVKRGRVPDQLYASLANLKSSEMIQQVATEALQIHGANGYMQGHPMEYMYRMARGRRLGAGTDEIQKNTIASTLKKDGLPDPITGER